jgi:uncharacterized surface protein with fasciclin (FAS1) repeats
MYTLVVTMQFKALTLAAVAATASAQTMDLTAALQNQTSLSNLTTYLGAFPQFISQLSGQQNITLLAPSNEAFTKLQNQTGGIPVNGTGLITALFSYHVLQGRFANFSDMPRGIPSELMPGAYANVTGGQRVVSSSNATGSTFYSGLDLKSTAASGAINFTGGVIHIIDAFLTIPQNVSTTAVDLGLSALAGSATQAGLISGLESAHDITIFAPNNAAFAAIGSAFQNVSNSTISSVLAYHVISGVYYSHAATNTTVRTLNGANITVTVINETVFINSARVIIPNIPIANGVVHVIDEVLNPANTTAAPNPTATSGGTDFSGVSSVSGTPFTSGILVPSSSVATSNAPGATSSSSSSGGAAAPMITGAVGAAALFGGAAVMMNM